MQTENQCPSIYYLYHECKASNTKQMYITNVPYKPNPTYYQLGYVKHWKLLKIHYRGVMNSAEIFIRLKYKVNW